MKQEITAPQTRAVEVVVYEPRQSPEQEEVILDRFRLEEGETREVDVASATAGYRFERLARSSTLGRQPDYVKNPQDIPKAQEAPEGVSRAVREEMDAGQKATRSYKELPGKRPAPSQGMTYDPGGQPSSDNPQNKARPDTPLPEPRVQARERESAARREQAPHAVNPTPGASPGFGDSSGLSAEKEENAAVKRRRRSTSDTTGQVQRNKRSKR